MGKRPTQSEGSPPRSLWGSRLSCWNINLPPHGGEWCAQPKSLNLPRLRDGDSSGELFLSPPRLRFRNDALCAYKTNLPHPSALNAKFEAAFFVALRLTCVSYTKASNGFCATFHLFSYYFENRVDYFFYISYN